MSLPSRIPFCDFYFQMSFVICLFVGSDSTILPITISADATPELDERFFVQLESISPSSQRLNAAAVRQVNCLIVVSC